jgi:phage shock protein PspC (stress-responsive transcriptional regulator)
MCGGRWVAHDRAMTSEQPGFEPSGDDVTTPAGAGSTASGTADPTMPPPGEDDGPPAPGPGGPPPPRCEPDGDFPRMRRTRGRDAVVAGVAGGIARELGIDPLFVRAAFVLLAVAGGSGFLLYAAGWLLLPDEGDHEPIGIGFLHRHGHRPWLLIGLAVAAVAIVGDGWDRSGWPGPWFVIVVVGLFVASRRRRHGPRDQWNAPPVDEPWPGHDEPSGWEWSGPTLPAPSTGRPRSLVPRVLLGLLALAAVDLLLVVAHLPALPVTAVLALGLVMTGVALVLGVRRDRWGGLLALGVALMAALALAIAAQAALAGGVGTRVYHATDPAGLGRTIRLGAGDLTLDLADLQVGAPVTVTGRVGAGHLDVIVPAGMALSVRAHSGIGQVDVLGTVHEGVDVDQQVNLPGTAAGGSLRLDLAAGVGDVEVRRAA